MASSTTLLPLLALLLTFQLILYVKSDEALISQLCNKTGEPVICSDCLNSDPSSKTANGNGLALKAVICAKDDTTIMFESISKLSKMTPMGSPLKTILEDCISNTSVVLQLYDGISFNVNLRDYGTAKEIIFDDVIPFSNACLNEFNRRPELAVPADVLSGTQAINQDAEVMMGIFDCDFVLELENRK